MKKINLTPFTVIIRTKDGDKEIPYGLKESIIDILFNPALKLKTVSLLKQDDLAKKILGSGDELLLEDEEYARLKNAIEIVEGLGKNDVEMVHRILDASSVDIKEK